MKYFSMFSGVGGFDLALNRLGHTAVGYSEIDKYAIQTYQKNFGKEVVNYGDCTKIRTDDLPEFDLLCGGFPCQSFSIAGKRRGFDDTRGTLFFEIARILKVKRPSYFLLENVKGLLNHDQGKTFSTIISTLDELGYEFQWMVLNSKFFGVPQNRERVFLVGNIRGRSRPEILPFGQSSPEIDSAQQQISSTIHSGYYKQGGRDQQYINEINYARQSKAQHSRVYNPEGISPTLAGVSKLSGNCTPKIVASRGRNPENSSDRTIGAPTEQRLEINEEGTTNTLTSVQKDNLVLEPQMIRVQGDLDKRKVYLSSECQTLAANPTSDNIPKIISHSPRSGDPKKGGTGILASSEHCFTLDSSPHYVNAIRRLTPTECEKLQGFPIGWTAGIADTNRYKQLGNAVTVNVIEAIISKL